MEFNGFERAANGLRIVHNAHGATTLKFCVTRNSGATGYFWNKKAMHLIQAQEQADNPGELAKKQKVFETLTSVPTDYLFQLKQIDSGHMFQPLDTVITLQPGQNYPVFKLSRISLPELIDYEGIIRNVMRNDDGSRDVLAGVSVTMRNLGTGQVNHSTTDSNGRYLWRNIRMDNRWKTGFFAKKDTLRFGAPAVMEDTLRKRSYTLVPRNIPVPGENGVTVPITIAQIEEVDFTVQL